MNTKKETLVERIKNKDAKICVIGLGQVGLPTALTFSNIGFSTIGNDINENLLATLNSGNSPFEEKGLGNILKSCISNNLFHTTNNLIDAVKNSDIIIVCVATPLTKNIRPDLSALEKVCSSLSVLSLEGKLVIIESSIPPGTFETLVLPALKKKNEIGLNCWAAFVPERLAPGQAFAEIRTTPRVIGYYDEESGVLAKILYEKMVNAEILVTPIKVAEISKLVENTFRDVNIAFANEVGLICENYDIDVTTLLKVCNSHPRVNILQPGPGVGGPCLPKDPYLLLNPQNMNSIDSKIILQARQINDSMPLHVIDLIHGALKEQNKEISNSTVIILGVTYKANVSDTRFSPSETIIPQLVKTGCNVLVYDPKTQENFGGKTVSDVWKGISESDVVIVVTDHDEFKEMDLGKIKKLMKNPTIIDTRRAFDNQKAESLGIRYIAIGYAKKLKNK